MLTTVRTRSLQLAVRRLLTPVVITTAALLIAWPGLPTGPTALGAPVPVDTNGVGGQALSSVSCPSADQCTAVAASGEEVTFDPGSPGQPQPVSIDSVNGLSAVACPTTSQCTAVDGAGEEVTFDPTSPGTPTPVQLLSSQPLLNALACPSVAQCTAVTDPSGQEVTFDPHAPGNPAVATIDRSSGLFGIACPSLSQCTAVGDFGDEVTFDPAAPARARTVSIDSSTQLQDISCPSQTQCTANGELQLTTFDPRRTSGARTISIDDGVLMDAIDCPLPTECTAVGSGDALSFDPQSTTAPTAQLVDPGNGVGLTDVSCPSASQCTAVDNAGNEVTFAPTLASGGGAGPPNENGPGIPRPTCATHSLRFGIFTAYASCFTVRRNGAQVIARGRVRLNGLDIEPRAGAEIAIDPLSESISATAAVRIDAGSVELYDGALKLGLKGTISPLDVSRRANVKGLPLSGRIQLKPRVGGMQIDAQAQIGASKQLHVSGTVHLLVTNQLGLELNELKLQLGQLPIRQLLIRSAYLEYQRTSSGADMWSGQVTAQLPGGLPSVQGQLAILNGRLDSIGATVSNINKPVGEVVFLQSLGLDVVFIPHLAVTGSIGLSAGPKLPVLKRAGLSLKASLQASFAKQLTLTAKGELQLAGEVELANATAVWTVPGRLSFTGSAQFSLHGVGVTASGSGLATSRGFYFHGYGQVSLPGHAGARGFAYISEKGITSCALISAGPATALLGFGYRWGGKLQLWTDSCGALAFRSAAAARDVRASSTPADVGDQRAGVAWVSAARAPRAVFHVPAGQSQMLFGATGRGGLPTFGLRSPSGQMIDPAHGASGAIGRGGYVYLEDAATDTEYVAVVRPAAGSWTLIPGPGSVPIRSAGSALSAPPPRVQSAVRRRGRFEVLSWRTRHVPGQTLEFSEVGPGVAAAIRDASSARGQIRFLPAAGGGEARRIEITVDRAGLPEAVLAGARFRVAPPRAPTPPGRLTIARHGTRVTVRWRGVAHAYRYLVHLRASDGRDEYFERRGRSLTLGGVVAPDRLTVTVQTIAADGGVSRPSTAVASYRAGNVHRR